ncbi:hypothetical protein CEXT_709091 [Caerostris extrusa]|uniref:Uncharacterized protein n=1 Tax=Caerostris extrusa TaxID=172846 RepID=A0AAV4W0R6_CAEEX|nr:hypothetical protein CEXT_709091 [Caerostris extrusa]
MLMKSFMYSFRSHLSSVHTCTLRKDIRERLGWNTEQLCRGQSSVEEVATESEICDCDFYRQVRPLVKFYDYV